MAAQWVGYALEGVDYLSQLLGLLPLPTGIAGPISLAAPAAAAVQFAWKVLRESGREHRKRVLRERIVGLREFIESLSIDEPSPDQARASRDARTEWATAIGQLAVLVPRTMHIVEGAVPRHWLRQALLLYSPTPGAVWALHAVFYFCVMQVTAMVFVLLVQLVRGDWALAAGLAPAVGMFGVPLLISWGLAADLDRATTRPRNAIQRWLLSYVPDHRRRWVWHVLFYVSLAASMSLLAIVPDALDGDVEGILVGSGVWLLLLALSRAMAVRSPISRSWWQRWMLAYAPKRPWIWFLQVAFWLFLTGTVSTLAVAATMAAGEEEGGPSVALQGCLGAMLAAISWGLATDAEQVRVGPPTGARKWFLLYVPARRALWITHVLSYFCALSVLELLRGIVTGELRTTPESLVFVPVVYFVLATLVSRGVSIGLEPRTEAMPRPTVWLRLGKQPRGRTRRLLFWVGATLFYAAVFLLPIVVFLAVLEGSATFVLRILVPVVVVGGMGRWMVRGARDRQESEERPSPAAVV